MAADSGRGLVDYGKLANCYPAHAKELEQDYPKLVALSTMASFDVFSLRIGLRRLGIPVNDDKYLSLTPETQRELMAYMKDFTKPLLTKIYGQSDQMQIHDFSSLVGLFRSPNKQEALRNLSRMSSTLGIALSDIPAFLEDYGDIFLSVAYYRSSFDKTRGTIGEFLKWMEKIKENASLAQDRNTMYNYKVAHDTLNNINNTIVARISLFQEQFGRFWADINMRSFLEIKKMIESNHELLGGVLCGLSVKMGSWRERFPSGGGSPNVRADFLLSDIVPGLAKINEMANKISA